MNGPFIIHWFPLITHDTALLDLPCHQFVVLTHLRLKPWRWSRLCWCPACKEAAVSGKWFAHWECVLCWQSRAVFTVWWINPVDRLTCSHCDTLQNNIFKQLLRSQLDITWNWFPSTPSSQNAAHRRKEICSTCLFKESLPFVESKHPLPYRNLTSREPAVPSANTALHYGCIMLIPSLQLQKRNVSHAKKQSVWSRSYFLELCSQLCYFLQDSLQCSDCALSCAIWLLQNNEQLSRLSF